MADELIQISVVYCVNCGEVFRMIRKEWVNLEECPKCKADVKMMDQIGWDEKKESELENDNAL